MRMRLTPQKKVFQGLYPDAAANVVRRAVNAKTVH